MEIILKETIDTLGLEGEIVKVKPGYARNFLIPQQKAVAVNKATLARLQHEQQAISTRRDIEQRKAEALAAKLEAKVVTLTRRVGSENRLFGSVGTKDIAEQLTKNVVTIDRRSIMLSEPIKNVGETKVTIKVGYQMTTQITVQVVAEGREDTAEIEASLPEEVNIPAEEKTAEEE
jgi:large subunit ribosomal protein L9